MSIFWSSVVTQVRLSENKQLLSHSPRLAHLKDAKILLWRGKDEFSEPELISAEHSVCLWNAAAFPFLATVLKVETYTSVASFCAVYGSHRSIHQLEPLNAAVASSAPSGEKSQEDSRYRVFRVPPVRLRIKVYERRLQRQTIWGTGECDSLMSVTLREEQGRLEPAAHSYQELRVS